VSLALRGITLLALLAANKAVADQVHFVAPGPSQNSLWLAPATYNGSLLGPVGLVNDQGTWHIAQWGIPASLPTIPTAFDSYKSWQLVNGHASVVRYDTPTSKRVELGQSGFAVPCSTEFDLFLEPNSLVYAGYPQGIPSQAQTPMLSQITSLVLSLSAGIDEESTVTRCANTAGVDYAYYNASIILYNATSLQTLYYQIILRDTRAGYASNACTTDTLWFFTVAPDFGVSDTAPVLGASCLAPLAGQKAYRFEIASRLKSLIQEGPAGLDRNTEAWKVTGVYVGSGLQGSAVVRSTYESIALVARTQAGGRFYTVPPCRVFDTRDQGQGGPDPLAAGSRTLVGIAGKCGIPVTANAASLNVTVTGPTEAGHLRLFQGGEVLPVVSAINYAAGQTRANNTITPVSADGMFMVYVGQGSGSVHVILDVNGYYQ